MPPREAARSFNSLEFCLRFGSGSPLPLNYCLLLRRFMDISCPNLSPKMSVADGVRSNEQTTGHMAAHGCHFVDCSLCVLIVNIEIRILVLHANRSASCFV